MPGITQRSTREPLIKSRFLSHGTLEVDNIQESRRFYEEVLGLEVVQQTLIGLFIRLGGNHVYVCLESKPDRPSMPLLHHNGIDVASKQEVDEAHREILEIREEYNILDVTEPVDQHGVYSFYIQDRDRNWWEICYLPEDGYAYRFKDERLDLTGRTDLSRAEILKIAQRPMEILQG
ncbi:VOC family protein [Streptomyces malaysiensis]|uniref:VOC family protein n=1 Tax=Streptomyces malaysiensis TaxID=92644 RepID=UPI002B27ED6C|nr:VOC family protein [Streptomyces malaysiensis]